MERLNLEEENIIKDIKLKYFQIFRLKKELNDTAIKDMRNLFKLEKEDKATKYRIHRYIRDLTEHEEKEKKNCYKPVRNHIFQSNNYIEYKSKGDKNKTLSVKEYVKGALSDVRRFLATESHLKMMKKGFYFTQKAFFVLKIFKFLP